MLFHLHYTASKSTFEIITSLRTHATVLEAEIEEICKDLRINRTMGKKYGLDAFKEGETRLMRLRDEKKHNLQVCCVENCLYTLEN